MSFPRPATLEDRLRMLRDLGVVRSARGDRHFGELVERGWARVSYPLEELEKVDYHITDRGRAMAESLLPKQRPAL